MAAQCTHLQSKEKRSWVWKKKATAILWFFHPKTRRGENISGRSDGLAAGNYASWYLKFSVEKWAWLIWYALKFNENCPTRNFFRSVRSFAPPTILSFFRFVCWLCFGSLQNTLARWCEREQCSHCICEEKQRSCVLYAQWISRERDQCNVHEHVAFRKLKSQTVWRIWCFVWYVSFGLFSSFHSSRLRSSSSSYSSCWCCCWCCCWWWCYVCCFFCSFLYLKRAFDAVSCSNVRISECITAARCLYNKRKILGKNLPLTTCIHLSRICCVSFIVYHTYLVISFHSFFFFSRFYLSILLSSFFLVSHFWLWFQQFQSSSFALIPYCAHELRVLSLSTHKRQREREKKKTKLLKMEFSAFSRENSFHRNGWMHNLILWYLIDTKP